MKEEEYLVPMIVNPDMIPTDSTLETELRWSADSGISFETPVNTSDGYQIRIPNTLLSQKFGGTLLLEVSNDPNYPRVSILLDKDGLEDELVRVESALTGEVGDEQTSELRGVVYPTPEDEDPTIISFDKN